jgi:hypothetical protein
VTSTDLEEFATFPATVIRTFTTSATLIDTTTTDFNGRTLGACTIANRRWRYHPEPAMG